MSLKLKTALLFSGLLLAAMAALSATLARGAARALAREQGAEAERRADALAEVCRGTLFSQQDLHVANYLRRLKASPDVVEAHCVDGAGRFIGHTAVERVGEAAPAAGFPGPGRLSVDRPVTLDGLLVGAARIVFDRAVLDERLARETSAARRRVWGAALPVIAAGFAGVFVLTGLLIRPLEDVAAGARAIGGGTLGHRIPVKTRDEIGVLAGEFNRMAGRLAELDEMKRDFVDGVTHDLKSPLAAILAAAEAAREGEPAVRHAQLDVVRAKATSLRDLVTTILEVAHIESGLVLNRKAVKLEEVVDRVVAAHRPEAARKGLSLEHVAESPPPALSLDETKIERALGNLVSNAVKFTDKGAVWVRTASEGGGAVVRVEDTGTGLPPELAGRLFTKFSRAARGPNASKEGTGLGLAVVKGIVEAHGGSVSAEARPEGGAVFTVRLPGG